MNLLKNKKNLEIELDIPRKFVKTNLKIYYCPSLQNTISKTQHRIITIVHNIKIEVLIPYI